MRCYICGAVLLFFFFSFLPQQVNAQEDPIRQLKVVVAHAARYDTLPEIRQAETRFRKQLAQEYLVDRHAVDEYALRYYNKMKASGRAEEIICLQIFKKIPQDVSAVQLQKVESLMDSLYQCLSYTPQQSMQLLVDKYSDSKDTLVVKALQTTEEFEHTLFSMHPGQISSPFYTPSGIHIVKVLERKEWQGFGVEKEKIVQRLSSRYGYKLITGNTVEKLKKEYAYQPDRQGMEELLSKGKTRRTLFTLEGHPYDGVLFNLFAQAHLGKVAEQLEHFISKSVLDYENNKMEQKHPEIASKLAGYSQSLLSDYVTRKEIGEDVLNDRIGMIAYFNMNKDKYRWEKPLQVQLVIGAANRRTARKVKKFDRKLVKDVPHKLWGKEILKKFNAEGRQVVSLVQGQQEASSGFPYQVVIGKQLKGPDDYREVWPQLQKDYRHFVESRWARQVYRSGRVEINQEDLKTVNTH